MNEMNDYVKYLRSVTAEKYRQQEKNMIDEVKRKKRLAHLTKWVSIGGGGVVLFLFWKSMQ